jgi:endoglucanase
MSTRDDRLLFDLLQTASPTGAEMPGQKVWAEGMRPVSDEVSCDAYGNTWATLTPASAGGLTVMLEAHADEIGFMVQYLSDDGFITLIPVGGSDVTIARGKSVAFLTSKGPVRGVIGNTAIHLRKGEIGQEKAPQWSELFVDIGAKNKAEVLERGIRVGIFAVYDSGPMELSETRLCGRAIDNRISGYLLNRVFSVLKEKRGELHATVHAVNAVQEEVGGNGAVMISRRLKPDCALVFDVTHATDTPGVDKKKHGEVKLGSGPTLTHGTANHPLMVDRLMQLAVRDGIPLQHEATSRSSGTDTDKIFISSQGIPSALISIPLRYMHSPVETMDWSDFENTVKLVVAFLLDLKPGESGFSHRLT